MRRILTAGALAALAACSPQSQKTTQSAAPPAAAPIKPVASPAPPGAYKLDPSHTSIVFRVSHLGLSNYTRRFTRMTGDLQFDPAHPQASRVNVTIDPRSLQTDYPEPQKLNFNAEIQGRNWLDAAKFPEITFRSTKVELTGPDTARITGDLSLHGVTRPVTLDAKFNGGYPAGGMDPMGSRIGFSAHGALTRSDFGVKLGVPAPGSTMGVGDQVEILIESEFTQPGPAPAAPPS